jgi:type IV secretion system protein VirD4
MRGGSEHTGGDALLAAILGALLGVAGLVWLWGGVAGAVFGSGWPHVAAADLPGVLLRLPAHFADPAAAWPGRTRGLPGAAAFYATLAALGAGVGAALTCALRAGLIPGGGFGAGGSRWAAAGELGPLGRGRAGGPPAWSARRGSAAAGPGVTGGARIALGRSRGRLLYAEERHALVAFGPPQSGKSAGLAVPALLEWHGPAVASSIKTDLLATTCARREQLGDVLVFDPFALGGDVSHTWSPLHCATTWDGALEAAWRLASAGELDQRGVEGGDFWAVAAEQRLAPLLYAAAASGGGMAATVRWAYGQDAGGLARTLQRLTDGEVIARDNGTAPQGRQQLEDAQAAYDAVRAFEAQADRTRSSIEGTVQALLRAYRFSRVARSAASCEITPDRLLDGNRTLYLVGDAKASKLLRPLFVALISEIVDRAYERATLAGGRLERPLLLCLDEAGNVAPLPNLAEIASTAPSHNIQIVSIFHDVAQARSRYGGQAETVINSHRARMLLPGVADLETLRYFSGLVGDAEVRETSRTFGAGGQSRSIGRRRQPLVAPEALRRLPEGEALLLYGRLAPARVRLRMWFKDRRLRALAAGQTKEAR